MYIYTHTYVWQFKITFKFESKDIPGFLYI